MNKAEMVISLLTEAVRWEPNSVGGIKGVYTSRADIEFRIDINPHKNRFSWVVGRVSSDRFVNQGESSSEDSAKVDAIKFIRSMEARGIA